MLVKAIDWSTVDEVSAWHFNRERAYLEGLVHNGLACGGDWGIISMTADSLSQSKSGIVELRQCHLVFENGLVAHISGNDYVAANYENLNKKPMPIWLSPRSHHPVERDKEVVGSIYPEVKFTESGFQLSVELNMPGSQAIQVGCLSGDGEILNSEFIPRCMYLKSHPCLRAYIEDIQNVTGQCIIWAAKNDKIHNQGLKSTLILSLIPLAQIVDWRLRPATYFERIIWMLYAHMTLLPIAAPADIRVTRLADNCGIILKSLNLNDITENFYGEQFNKIIKILKEGIAGFYSSS
jgi:hypothetical protein